MSDRDLVRHIFDEVVFLRTAASATTLEAFLGDEVLKRAFARSLEIVGEASKKLTPEFREAHPSIEWRLMAGTRDKLIHDYFGVDYGLVWDIVVNELPGLETELRGLLE
ncbi:MAG TPA: DUF86 domain-containing protein [Thermoanaerobaculia bacterium]|nr:DUF86 domain-containing protein [Thermoanaerobaculia bacterium]